MRLALAENWTNLVRQARTPRAVRDPRVPFNRGSVLACESLIHEMLDALLAPLPLPARGAAMASRLLSDGSGPVYDGRRSADLGVALRHAIAHLDPSVALASSDY
jgi:hypothetical protein